MPGQTLSPAKTRSPAAQPPKSQPTAPPKPKPGVSAVEMGARQREISVSEFFTKNRHLLGFDNPRKALLTCVKEAVDNALDACEPGQPVPDHGHRQRTRHHSPADSSDLREALVWVQLPSAAHESGTA